MKASIRQTAIRYCTPTLPIIACLITVSLIAGGALHSPLQAGGLYDFKNWYRLGNLSGGGEYVGYQRNVDSKDRNFPLAVVSDGYKMVRIYEDLPDVYLVEWVWQMTITNQSGRAVNFSIEYKLRDSDLFLVSTSYEPVRTIASGQTITIEKTDILPYEKAKPVDNSNWYIKLH